MTAPTALEDGWLPDGVHDTTVDELKARFGVVKSSDRRPRLFTKLIEYLSELQQWKISDLVFVDGSFVSERPDPNDIDLVVCVREDLALRDGDLLPHEHNLIDKGFVRRHYEVDLWPALGAERALAQALAFTNKKPPQEGRKGVLRLRLL